MTEPPVQEMVPYKLWHSLDRMDESDREKVQNVNCLRTASLIHVIINPDNKRQSTSVTPLTRRPPMPVCEQKPSRSTGVDITKVPKVWFLSSTALQSDDEMMASRTELHLTLQHPQLCTLPFLILANHQDSPAARSVPEVSCVVITDHAMLSGIIKVTMSAHGAPPLKDLVRLRQCQLSKADAVKQSVSCLFAWASNQRVLRSAKPMWNLSIAPKRMPCNLNCLVKAPDMDMKRHSYLQLSVNCINNAALRESPLPLLSGSLCFPLVTLMEPTLNAEMLPKTSVACWNCELSICLHSREAYTVIP
ncbi:ADP-ribosylation factor-like protein 15 [Triplophysa tibetana]|uniref:ADP-ribosylation factor-like protein 15 n=1 Tax=Triplophysa tibetana TaxID=1572043 RepID=A0A5A9P6Q8_9TELE|nr:ADP-ribosylation factor-like protein 15 [Triplophysa tibetana]